jgi:hypothetical protein
MNSSSDTLKQAQIKVLLLLLSSVQLTKLAVQTSRRQAHLHDSEGLGSPNTYELNCWPKILQASFGGKRKE